MQLPECRHLAAILGSVLLLSSPAGAREPTPSDMLQSAIEDYSAGEGRWAYREVKREYDRKGRLKAETVSRIDPSLPWDERDILLSSPAGPATEKEQRQYQKKREKERRAIERGAHRERRLRELIDFAGVRTASQSSDTMRLALPILPDPDRDFPVDKIAMTADLDRFTGELRAIHAELREPVRHKAVANIKGMNLEIQFRQVEGDDRPAALSFLRGTARASLLFFPVGGSIEIARTDHRWVTPYDERFNVEIGTPTAIDF